VKPFEYFAPRTLHEALDILVRYGGDARPIAGGTDLLLKMKLGEAAPRAVVNIKHIPELRRRYAFPNRLTLGALTTVEEIRRSCIVRDNAPALAMAAATMASTQIRNLATLGGNLCTAAPSADLAPVLMALSATVHIAGPGGERCIPLDEFFLGPGQTALAPNELVISADLPRFMGPALYLKHMPRESMDIAVAGVGIALSLSDGRCESARIVLGAVAPKPMRALQAEAELTAGPFTPERIARTAHIAAQESQPIDDVRGASWYRRHMIEVMTRRGLSDLRLGAG